MSTYWTPEAAYKQPNTDKVVWTAGLSRPGWLFQVEIHAGSRAAAELTRDVLQAGWELVAEERNTMTKKDYELLAKALGESLNKENMLDHICKVLKNGNPKFDQEKFIACMREAALTDD